MPLLAVGLVLASTDGECPTFAAFAANKGPAPEGLRCKTVHLIRHAEGTHNAAELMADRRRLFEKSNETRALREEHGRWRLHVMQTRGRRVLRCLLHLSTATIG